jgi:hypothetical protein
MARFLVDEDSPYSYVIGLAEAVHMVRTAAWPIIRHLSTLGPQCS